MKSTTEIIINKLSFLDDLIIENGIDMDVIKIRPFKQFIHIFSSIKDCRIKNKCTYSIEDLLLIIFFAKIAEEGSNCSAIARYARLYKEELGQYGILKKDKNGEYLVPSHDCFRYFLMHFDNEEIKKALISRISRFLDNVYSLCKDSKKKYDLLNIDGQEFRGTGRCSNSATPSSNLATLNIYDASSYLCIYSIPISRKESEIKTARKILTYLNLSKKIITADALHTQLETAELIMSRRGNYVFRVKENQSGLLQEIITRFRTSKWKKETIETDERSFTIMTLPKTYIGNGFAGQKAYIKVISKMKSNKNDELYFISSLSNTTAIKEAIENRWSIENDLHKGKDFYLDEDQFRIKDKTAVANFSVINNVLSSFFKITQSIFHLPTLIEARKKFKLHPMQTMELLTTLISTNQLVNLIKEKMES